jgi:DNA-binding NarL/FixJ family response regulator
MRRHEDAQRNAREVPGPARASAAERRGVAMSMATTAEYALMLTAPHPPLTAGTARPGKLTPRKQELVTLVARGRTDAQIAA